MAAQYLDDLHHAARNATARLLVYTRHGEHHAGIIAEATAVVAADRRGEQMLPNLLVVYSAERGAIRTGYQFSDLSGVRMPEDAQWLR